jgi:CIC family chloride channel protein
MFGRQPWYLLALLAAGKILVTSVTLNAGGSGGVFTPSLYIGAVAGGAFGVVLSDLLPNLSITPEAYALVGMGALVAAATEAPITGILIVFPRRSFTRTHPYASCSFTSEQSRTPNSRSSMMNSAFSA